ncbi:hypothetical protein [Treponema phagedenis]|uniref:hypothetical protein n=1 Tax=Treponema phagedenis TaxID=162 RepID=UPI001655199C|nr:hypothetical protein [Treponema phagedenis]
MKKTKFLLFLLIWIQRSALGPIRRCLLRSQVNFVGMAGKLTGAYGNNGRFEQIFQCDIIQGYDTNKDGRF